MSDFKEGDMVRWNKAVTPPLTIGSAYWEVHMVESVGELGSIKLAWIDGEFAPDRFEKVIE